MRNTKILHLDTKQFLIQKYDLLEIMDKLVIAEIATPEEMESLQGILDMCNDIQDNVKNGKTVTIKEKEG